MTLFDMLLCLFGLSLFGLLWVVADCVLIWRSFSANREGE